MIVDLAREFVLKACQSPSNHFSPEFFEQHILVVADYADQLAKRFNADAEIVALAALLHDVGAIQDFSSLPKHPEAGAKAAEQFLMQHSYPIDRINRVKQCILTHSAPVLRGAGSAEEICVSNADAISQIVKPAYWLYYTFVVRKNDFKTGWDWYRTRLDWNWGALAPEARELIDEDYQVIKNMMS